MTIGLDDRGIAEVDLDAERRPYVWKVRDQHVLVPVSGTVAIISQQCEELAKKAITTPSTVRTECRDPSNAP